MNFADLPDLEAEQPQEEDPDAAYDRLQDDIREFGPGSKAAADAMSEAESREAEEIGAVEEAERRAAAEQATEGRTKADQLPQRHPDPEKADVLAELSGARILGVLDAERWHVKREGIAIGLSAAAADLEAIGALPFSNPATFRTLCARAADRYRGAIALLEAEAGCKIDHRSPSGGQDGEGEWD